MRASIVKRNDKYYVVTDIAPGPTAQAAAEAARQLPDQEAGREGAPQVLVELDGDLYVEPSSRTLQAYLLEDWLPAMSTPLRPSTLAHLPAADQGYLLPALGQHRLSDLGRCC